MKISSNDHTFVVCAYQASPFLEACIRSCMQQEVPTRVMIATSTPNDWIRSIADKYQLPL